MQNFRPLQPFLLQKLTPDGMTDGQTDRNSYRGGAHIKISVPKNSGKMKNTNLIYGTIVAKEMAKYKPSSPVILRK